MQPGDLLRAGRKTRAPSGADPDRAAQDQATLNDALELLVRERASQALAGKRSEQTVAFYRKKAGVVLHHLGRALRLARIDARVVDDYIEKRRFDGAAENTIAKELATLRAALKLCKRRKLWAGDVQAVMPVGFETQYEPTGNGPCGLAHGRAGVRASAP